MSVNIHRRERTPKKQPPPPINYNFNVNMYNQAPLFQEQHQNIIQATRLRLQLYQILQFNRTFADVRRVLESVESPFAMLLKSGSLDELKEIRKIDHLSHYILQVAYRSKNVSTFIRYELEWFKYRFDVMTDCEKMAFLKENAFELTLVTQDERDNFNLSPDICFKLEFNEAPQIISKAECSVHNGFMYISLGQVLFWLLDKLEDRLTSSTEHLKKYLVNNPDEHIEGIIELFDLVGPFYNRFTSVPVHRSELDEKAIKNFPLCMRFQHEHLRETHHLKYFSRMQYGLFLKGIGLPLEECLTFWRDEFIYDMPEDHFWQKYSYLFKHQYGTVGSKIDQPPYNCQEIMDQIVLPNQVNGCPYKHWDEPTLRNKLNEYEVSPVVIEEILDSKRQQKFTEACQQCFKFFCGFDAGEMQHPNEYYMNSCRDIEDLAKPQ